MIHGYDISAYQGTTAPLADFDFVKASEGARYTNSKFAAQYASAKTRAKHRGGYHFARPEQSSYRDQANRFLDIVQPVPGESVWLDLEASQLSQSATNTWARGWGDHMRDHVPGVTSGVYLGRGYATSGTGKGLADHFDYWWWPQYPSAYQLMADADEEELRAANRSSLIPDRVPIAAMTSSWPPAFSPWLPSGITTGWTRPHIWQWTDNFAGVYDASVSWLTLDQLAHGGRTPQEVDMLSGSLSAGAGEKPAIVVKPGAFTTVHLAWDNTLTLTDPAVTRKPPARFRLAPHQPGRTGTTVTVEVGAALDDTKGRPDCAAVKLPTGCDYIGVVRLDDGDGAVGFVVY